eukprot:scaffold8735_cov129-Isochrysis_galbana.AAC.8
MAIPTGADNVDARHRWLHRQHVPPHCAHHPRNLGCRLALGFQQDEERGSLARVCAANNGLDGRVGAVRGEILPLYERFDCISQLGRHGWRGRPALFIDVGRPADLE